VSPRYRLLAGTLVTFVVVLSCGCALFMPPKYDLAKQGEPGVTKDADREMAKRWKHVLDRRKDYEAFESRLKALQKEENHRAVIFRMSLYFQTYPVVSLGLFDVSQRLRYATLILIYTDSLLADGQVEEAGRMLQQARAIVPFNPQIRLKTRELVRIHRRDLLFGRLHPYFDKVPAVDTNFVALTREARKANVVLPPTSELFATNMVKLGMWEAPFYDETYGSALFWEAPPDSRRIPVVLVHGVNGSPRDFAGMVARFEGTPYQPLYFFYPTGIALKEASKSLARALEDFVKRNGVERFAVVAHSMGGLVTKGVLNQVDVPKDLPGWKLFVSISTPWTGFEAAEKIKSLPYHPASLQDMWTKSDFLKKVHSTPIPKELSFYMFFGAKGGTASFSDGNDDEIIPLTSVLTSPVTGMALDVFGFYETHVSVVDSDRVFQRLRLILDDTFELPAAGKTP
jgi:pimeloyl-ACP methyl ester carboxylesterase